MAAIAIVSEYNPFHNGHLYQIQKIKAQFPDPVIISVMSGSLVQRGEIALLSKYNRAKIAVTGGVDVVFELPSVYSNAPANIFAYSAVYIAEKLTGVDYICFGSEAGDLAPLGFAAEKIMGEEFESKLRGKIKINKAAGYPKNVYDLFCELYGEKKAAVLNGSNNILAIEYLKALKKLNSGITPITIKRTGADYSAGASCIRESIDSPDIKNFMPGPAYEIFRGLINNGQYADTRNIGAAVISHINRLDTGQIAAIAEVSDIGEAHRIKKSLDGCFDYDALADRLNAKHNTSSSVRRMILNVFFGITKDMQKSPPDFTVLLAMTEKGAAFLNGIKKKTGIAIVTKPAAVRASKTFAKNLFIDNACKLALFNKTGEINEIKQKPYIYLSDISSKIAGFM